MRHILYWGDAIGYINKKHYDSITCWYSLTDNGLKTLPYMKVWLLEKQEKSFVISL